jgi:hypothetical protein
VHLFVCACVCMRTPTVVVIMKPFFKYFMYIVPKSRKIKNLHNEKFQNLYSSRNIINVVKSSKIDGACIMHGID